MKIGTNLSLAVQMLAFCDGSAAGGKRAGSHERSLVDVLTHSVIASPIGAVIAGRSF